MALAAHVSSKIGARDRPINRQSRAKKSHCRPPVAGVARWVGDRGLAPRFSLRPRSNWPDWRDNESL